MAVVDPKLLPQSLSRLERNGMLLRLQIESATNARNNNDAKQAVLHLPNILYYANELFEALKDQCASRNLDNDATIARAARIWVGK